MMLSLAQAFDYIYIPSTTIHAQLNFVPVIARLNSNNFGYIATYVLVKYN